MGQGQVWRVMHTGAPTLSQLQLWDAEQWQGPILVTASSHGCPRETATPRVAKCLGDNPTWPLPQSRATAMAAAVAQQGPWPGAASSKGLHLPPLLQPNPVTTSMSAPHLHPTSSTLTSMPIPPPPHTPVSILVPSPCLLAAPSSCTPLSISSMLPLTPPPPPPSLTVAAPTFPTHPTHVQVGSAPGFLHFWCCHPAPRPPPGTAPPHSRMQPGLTPSPGLFLSARPGPRDTEPFIPQTHPLGWTLDLFHVSLIETAGGGVEPRTKAGCRNRGLHRPRCGGPPPPNSRLLENKKRL